MKCLAAALLVLLAPGAFAADVLKGGQIYRMHCASCHGASGISTMPNAVPQDPALNTATRAIRTRPSSCWDCRSR
mgnify:CR=1 FL=1